MNSFFHPKHYVKKDKKIEKMRRDNHGELSEEMKEIQFADRGISFDKNDKPIIAANQFIKYAMTRVTARENEEGIWFYNYKAKHYDLLTYEKYKKIFFYIMEEASEEVWRSSMEKQYMAYFRNKVEQFQISGDQAGILQFNNCIVDFSGEEVEVLEPSPAYFCNFRLPYDYDEEAKCPAFREFLNDIFDGDNERIALIQEIMGACLFYEKCMQYLVVFLGNGSNGKSLLASVIKHMLGDQNVSAIALDKLSGDKFAKQNLDRKLLNISSETKSEKIYSTADLKALTGGDSVEVEKKFKDAYTTEIYCKYILLANEMFQTDDNSEGFYRRLIIVPFNQHYYKLIPGEEKDENKQYQDIYLEGTLTQECSGIFNFALEGLLRLWENDFHFSYSTVCEQAKERFKKEHNIVMAFLNECLLIRGIDSKVKVKSSELFPKFERFCRENHYTRQYNNMTKAKFFKLLDQIIADEALDVAKRKNSDSYYFVGMTFKK
ncbi:phage/plasmid primase, P4 family [Ruminococcus sp.]|uniref:DNA primase family protein n=1 Tax=Ruminococcus sp. TaxID=41978 RepID=UPI0025E44C7C|nr:phage/plasmid primase, P4 family [Ruminococcus sp.]